jgi:DNA transformation protein
MFRDAGVFSGGMMFGLLVRETMYFRVDDTTRSRYESASCQPFSYNRRGQTVSLYGYYSVSEELFDQPDELLLWARDAAAVARALRRRR